MKNFKIVSVIVLLVIALAAFSFGEQWLAMGLAVSSMMLLLLPTAPRKG